MFESLADISDTSKVWIYQSPKILSSDEIPVIRQKTQSFIHSWTAHGATLKAAFEIKHERFLIIAVDEIQAAASGCSIDKLMKFIQELGQMLAIDFLDRMQVSYRDSNNQIQTCHIRKFETLIQSKDVTPNTVVFNNMVTSKKEFDSMWEIPLKESWHKKLLAE